MPDLLVFSFLIFSGPSCEPHKKRQPGLVFSLEILLPLGGNPKTSTHEIGIPTIQDFIHKAFLPKIPDVRKPALEYLLFWAFFCCFSQVFGSPTYSTTKRAGCITFNRRPVIPTKLQLRQGESESSAKYFDWQRFSWQIFKKFSRAHRHLRHLPKMITLTINHR